MQPNRELYMSSPKLTRSNSLPANIGTGAPPPASSPGHSGKAGKSSSHTTSHLMPHAKKRATGETPSSMAPRGGLSQLSGAKSRDLPNPFENLESQWDAPMPSHTGPHSGFPPPPSPSFTPQPFSLMDMDMYPPTHPNLSPPESPSFPPSYPPNTGGPSLDMVPAYTSHSDIPPHDEDPVDVPESRGGSSGDRMEALMEMQEKAALQSVAMQMAAARNNEFIAQGQTVQNASEMTAKASKAASSSTLGLL